MSTQKIDCLFIHVPHDIPDTRIAVTFMAMGVFALADYLHRNGFSSKIVHLGVEKIADNVIKLLRDKELAVRMGRSGNSKLKEEFDIDRVVRDLEEVYKGMVKSQ